jgi:hypothetical protein
LIVHAEALGWIHERCPSEDPITYHVETGRPARQERIEPVYLQLERRPSAFQRS